MRRVIIASLLAILGRTSSKEEVDLNRLDDKIDDANFGTPLAISNGEFRLFRDKAQTSDLRNLFKEIARESDEYAYIIDQCVSNVDEFVITNLIKDEKFLTRHNFIKNRSSGRSIFEGGKRSIILVDMFNDVESLKKIVLHECLHAWQDVNSIIYTPEIEKELDQCVIGIHHLLDKIVLCFNGDKSECDDLGHYSEHFQNQRVTTRCPDPKLAKGGAYLDIKFFNSIVEWKSSLLMKYEPIEGTNNLCIKFAIGTENKETKERIIFSDEEKYLLNMANFLNDVADRKEIAKSYRQQNPNNEKTDKEIHAGLFGIVSTEMLNQICKPKLVERLSEASKNKKQNSR